MLIYWRQNNAPFNYGDYISELLLDLFLTIDRDKLLSDRNTAYHLIGSTISNEWIDKSLNAGMRPLFWGCGCRGTPIRFDRASYTINGVRGIESRKLLGGTVPIIGDSGLLLPLLVPREKRLPDESAIFVPHFWDPAQRLKIDGVRNISAQVRDMTELRHLIQNIANAPFVLAGAMHAAVTAIAYDVPFAFYQDGPQGFLNCPPKWTDLASAHGFDAHFVRTLEEGRAWYHAIQTKLRFPSMLRLLEHAPFAIRPEVRSRARDMDQVRGEHVWLQ